ncbi:MAG: diadenylate cyclase CdaA [Bacteroidales bacterium]|jgi:uncharacterized protein (TIGR00159 family)|nr:diadenylate cyclase CdaA [Bacteroidales bacterium]
MLLFFIQSIHISFWDIIDILIVAFLIYELYYFMRNTVGVRILVGFVLLFVMWRTAQTLNMLLMSQILGAFMGVGVIAVVIVFQPEIRQLLLMLGNVKFLKRVEKGKFPFFRVSYVNQDLNIDAIVMACQKMSNDKVGALIAITKHNELEQIMQTGTAVDALISEQLIENIFFKNSPLHDGAMIISHNKIAAVGAILPVSSNPNIPQSMGLRHRAAMGLSEATDAILVVVSEETGKIATFSKGTFTDNITPVELSKYLKEKFSS